MEKHTHCESMILVVLSILLVSVFGLSVVLYDDLAASAESGALAVFAEDVRVFLDENEAIAVFLGVEETTAVTENAPDAVDTAAEAYIVRYNGIYADLP